MSSSASTHRLTGPHQVHCAVITVSDTRTLETDRGGDLVVELLQAAGHSVWTREIIPDEPSQIASLLRELVASGAIQVILLTGGTGISPRDHTYATVRGLLHSDIPGYGELFRMLSYAEIGPAAILSRAIAGLMGQVVVVTMPGSPNGVRLALEKILLPELGHLVGEAGRSSLPPTS